MRRLAFIVLSILCFFCLVKPPAASASTTDILLFLDGTKLNPEVAPQKIGSTSMVPIRIISEALGAKVNWNPSVHQVTVEKTDVHLELVIDKKDAIVNGKHHTLEMAPLLIAGNTLLPVRFVAEQLGLQVNWEPITQSVYLIHNQGLTESSPSPETEIQSFKTVGKDFTIQVNGKVTPNIFPLSNPDRLVIDLPNTTLSSEIIPASGEIGSLQSNDPQIFNIRYARNDPEPSMTRVVLELKGKTSYKLLDNGSDKQLVVELNQAPRYKVVIDPGHGGKDSGAVSVTGRYEKDFTLATATKLKALLDKETSIDAYMTRSDDTFIPLDDRVALANNLHADLFVSIHGNKWTPSSRGTQTYYFNDFSLPFANVMHSHIVQATGFPDGHVRQEGLRVVKKTTMPAILIECGFLSNVTEEEQMFDSAFQEKIAATMVEGIKEQLKIQ